MVDWSAACGCVPHFAVPLRPIRPSQVSVLTALPRTKHALGSSSGPRVPLGLVRLPSPSKLGIQALQEVVPIFTGSALQVSQAGPRHGVSHAAPALPLLLPVSSPLPLLAAATALTPTAARALPS